MKITETSFRVEKPRLKFFSLNGRPLWWCYWSQYVGNGANPRAAWEAMSDVMARYAGGLHIIHDDGSMEVRWPPARMESPFARITA